MNVPLCFRAARSRRARGPAPWAALPPVGAGAGAGAGARAQSGVAEEEDELERPLHFSSSKASPRRWTVEHSLGSDRHRPWWKVLPLSISLLALICWCFWRVETDVDRWLTGSAEGQAPEAEVDPERPGS